MKIMENRDLAKVLFENMYKLHSIPIYSTPDYILFHRKMRAYLVKDEATLERLAKEKFDEDLLRNQHISKGNISSIEAHSSSFGSVLSRGAAVTLLS